MPLAIPSFILPVIASELALLPIWPSVYKAAINFGGKFCLVQPVVKPYFKFNTKIEFSENYFRELDIYILQQNN